MVLTVVFVLAILALLLTCASATGRCPVWVPVVLLCILEILRSLPLR